MANRSSGIELKQCLNLLRVETNAEEVPIDKAAAVLLDVEVVRVMRQAVVDQVLHVLRDDHHRAVALTPVDPLCFCCFGR